jgi:nucleoside-triphosphatase THEP1
MALTIVCAERGRGKTTKLREYATTMAAAGRSVGGVACPAVFEVDRRIGYDLVDLRRGSRRQLARVVTSPDVTPTVGDFHFDDSAIAEGNAAIIAAVRDGLDVIAIDEVGPLELGGRGWAPALSYALQTCDRRQELIVVVRSSLVDELPKRFPSPLWREARRVGPGAEMGAEGLRESGSKGIRE